jgi:hypothetical protein
LPWAVRVAEVHLHTVAAVSSARVIVIAGERRSATHQCAGR